MNVVEAKRNIRASKIPFYESPDWYTPKPTHCLPAVARMVIEYYYPGAYPWERIIDMMYKVPDKWTLTTGMVMSLNGLGLNATQITDFDYNRFVKDGMKYIRERYKKRPKSADEFEAYVAIPHEQAIAQNALRINSNAFEDRVPTVADLVRIINEPYSLVVVQFDAGFLAGSPRYIGHFGLAKAIDQEKRIFTFNDPGGSTHPPEENRVVSLDKFLKAWTGDQGVDGTMIRITDD